MSAAGPRRRAGRVLVQGALNGMRVAMTPAELAREAAAAVAAGAGSLHVHPYGPDGRESLAPDVVAAAVGAVRAACPGIEVGISTGEWIADDVPAAIAAWREPLPDMASVNFVEAHHPAVLAALAARGIGVEAGIFVVADVARLVASGVAERCRRILIEVDDERSDPVGEVAAIAAALDAAGVTGSPRLHHGNGPATWDVLRVAIAAGVDVRVGLEDVTVLPDGRAADGNGPLVAAAVALT